MQVKWWRAAEKKASSYIKLQSISYQSVMKSIKYFGCDKVV